MRNLECSSYQRYHFALFAGGLLSSLAATTDNEELHHRAPVLPAITQLWINQPKSF
jgi:hypothetical protein